MEPDHFRAAERLPVDGPQALDAGQPIGAAVLHGHGDTGIHRQFLGREELFSLDPAIDDPAVHVSLAAGVGNWHRLKVMAVLEIRVHVAFPVQLVDDEIKILVFVLGHVLDQERPRHLAPFHQRLVHPEHVRAPLRLVGAKRTRRMQHARRNQPARPRLEPVRTRKIQNPVVALVPVLKALPDLRLGRPGFKSHERIREIVPHWIVLRREIIGLRLSFLPHQSGLFLGLVHVVRNRPHVVEKLRVHRPLAILIPDRLSNQHRTALGDCLSQREPGIARHHITEALVLSPVLVRRRRRGSKPTLVNPAPVQPKRVEIVRMQLQTLAGLQERTRHPARGQLQKTARFCKGVLHQVFNIRRDGFQGKHSFHAGWIRGL